MGLLLSNGRFKLVNSAGDTLQGGQYGLLIYKGGTVCNDYFSYNSADAICSLMGYASSKKWDSGDKYDVQSSYDINLDEVKCTSGEWESCTFRETHDCKHSEDVFLSCISSSGSLTLGNGDATLLIIHSTNNLTQRGFDNVTSRYKIDNNDTWWFFDKPYFEDLLFIATGPIGWTSVDSRYNDKVSSVELARGSLTLGNGDVSLLITDSTNNLEQRGFDNTMSRYKIDGNETWWFFDKPNFQVPLFTATGPIGWTSVNRRHNDKVSSVQFVRGSLSLGTHSTAQQKGDTTLLIRHSTNSLAQRGFENTMSRYKIDSNETWWFFDKPNFQGLLFTATGPIGWTSVDNRYNDEVSSVELVIGRALILGKGYATLLITDSTNNLAQRGFDNTMSRYKINGNDMWLFFDKPNFQDLLFTATGPVGWTSVYWRYNDKISSIRLVKGQCKRFSIYVRFSVQSSTISNYLRAVDRSVYLFLTLWLVQCL